MRGWRGKGSRTLSFMNTFNRHSVSMAASLGLLNTGEGQEGEQMVFFPLSSDWWQGVFQCRPGAESLLLPGGTVEEEEGAPFITPSCF